MTISLSIKRQAAARGVTMDRVLEPVTELEVSTQEAIARSLRVREGLDGYTIGQHLNISKERIEGILR